MFLLDSAIISLHLFQIGQHVFANFRQAWKFQLLNILRHYLKSLFPRYLESFLYFSFLSTVLLPSIWHAQPKCTCCRSHFCHIGPNKVGSVLHFYALALSSRLASESVCPPVLISARCCESREWSPLCFSHIEFPFPFSVVWSTPQRTTLSFRTPAQFN